MSSRPGATSASKEKTENTDRLGSSTPVPTNAGDTNEKEIECDEVDDDGTGDMGEKVRTAQITLPRHQRNLHRHRHQWHPQSARSQTSPAPRSSGLTLSSGLTRLSRSRRFAAVISDESSTSENQAHRQSPLKFTMSQRCTTLPKSLNKSGISVLTVLWAYKSGIVPTVRNAAVFDPRKSGNKRNCYKLSQHL